MIPYHMTLMGSMVSNQGVVWSDAIMVVCWSGQYMLSVWSFVCNLGGTNILCGPLPGCLVPICSLVMIFCCEMAGGGAVLLLLPWLVWYGLGWGGLNEWADDDDVEGAAVLLIVGSVSLCVGLPLLPCCLSRGSWSEVVW